MKVFKRIIKITVLCFLLIACSYSIFIIYRLNHPIYEEVGLEILTTMTNTKFDVSGNPYFVVGGTIQEVKREKDTTLVTIAEPKYFQYIKSDRYELQNKISAGDYELYKYADTYAKKEEVSIEIRSIFEIVEVHRTLSDSGSHSLYIRPANAIQLVYHEEITMQEGDMLYSSLFSGFSATIEQEILYDSRIISSFNPEDYQQI